MVVNIYAPINKSGKLIVSRRKSCDVHIDLGIAGCSYLIVGNDQQTVVAVEYKRILTEAHCGGIEGDITGFAVCNGALEYREHLCRILGCAACLDRIGQSKVRNGVVLFCVQRSDSAAFQCRGIEDGVDGKGVAHVEYSCFGLSLEALKSNRSLVGSSRGSGCGCSRRCCCGSLCGSLCRCGCGCGCGCCRRSRCRSSRRSLCRS